MTPSPGSVPIRAYLSGGMEYADGEGRDWRAALQAWLEAALGWTVFNPTHESERFFATHYPGLDFRALKSKDIARYRDIAAQLVDIDCREIAERSDIVICFWDASAMRGAGTKGELTMARYTGTPVYLVTDIPLQEVPGWVLGCATHILGSFQDLKTRLAAEYRRP